MLADTVEALLILLGAVIGTAGSIVGSVVVGRQELTRTARIRIYRELLPPLIDEAAFVKEWRGETEAATAAFASLYREAVLAGPRDRRLAQMAVDLRHERDALPLETNADPEGNWEFTNESLAKRAEANERLLNVLRQFESFLEDKVR